MSNLSFGFHGRVIFIDKCDWNSNFLLIPHVLNELLHILALQSLFVLICEGISNHKTLDTLALNEQPKRIEE